MTRTILAVAAVMAMGCAGSDVNTGDWPAVEALYSMDGPTVTCESATVNQEWISTHTCAWERATLAGEPHCRVSAVFYQPDETGTWAVMFGSSDEGCGL